jgi:hypothetical protein
MNLFIDVIDTCGSSSWSWEMAIDIKRKNRMLKVCATFLAFFSFFLAVANNSTNEANKAGGTHC